MNQRGFSLIEILLACALLAIVGGAVASLADPIRFAIERTDSSAQLEPGGRGALETIAMDIREAGSDAGVANPMWRLARLTSRVFPMRDLDVEGFEMPGGAVRITRTPRLATQAVLRTPAVAGDVVLRLETTSRCSRGVPACGFSAGTEAALYNDADMEIVTIQAALGAQVVLMRPITSGFAAGAALSEVATATYGTRRAEDGSRQLVRLTSGGAQQPILDNIVQFEVTADTPDPARMTRVTVHVRLEAAPATLRGPAGYLFRRPGTATDARRWLPDVELWSTIALRNPSGDM